MSELLLWVKGPGFSIALFIFLLGVVLRLGEILLLRRKPDQAPAKGEMLQPALRTIAHRFLPAPGMLGRSPVVHIGGWVFHAGLFLILFLFTPHIVLVQAFTGLSWPGLSNAFIHAATMATMAGMLAVLAARLTDPVKKLLSDHEDYLVWTLTFLPLLTGFLTVGRVGLPYDTLLALHILSVELLLVVFPFTKLMHAVTWVIARGYTGAIAGRKGAHS
jgi:nitrate reductase gamma subunit